MRNVNFENAHETFSSYKSLKFLCDYTYSGFTLTFLKSWAKFGLTSGKPLGGIRFLSCSKFTARPSICCCNDKTTLGDISQQQSSTVSLKLHPNHELKSRLRNSASLLLLTCRLILPKLPLKLAAFCCALFGVTWLCAMGPCGCGACGAVLLPMTGCGPGGCGKPGCAVPA